MFSNFHRRFCYVKGTKTYLQSDAEVNRCVRDVARMALPVDAPPFPEVEEKETPAPLPPPDCACFDADELSNDESVYSFTSRALDDVELSSAASTYSTKTQTCNSDHGCLTFMQEIIPKKIPRLAYPEYGFFAELGMATNCPCPDHLLKAGSSSNIVSLEENETGAIAKWTTEGRYTYGASYTAATAKMGCWYLDRDDIENVIYYDNLDKSEFNRCYSNISQKIKEEILY